ncbi:7947_t:CDS:2 [Entrophospora sp. SA101]|nr:7947_t:CDS:2 [Entrophospora sp. SA101]
MEQVNSNVENIMNNSSTRKNLNNVHIMHSGDGKSMENPISSDNLYTNVQITSLSFPNIKIKQENQITYQNHDDNNYRNVKNISASSSDSSSPPSPSNSSTIINSNITTKMPINTQRTTRRQNLSTPSLIRPSAADADKYILMHLMLISTSNASRYTANPITHRQILSISTTNQLTSSSNVGEQNQYFLQQCRKRKLERNRIAAKQCRERKKIYVAKLESKVTRLEEENAHLRRELDELNTRLQFNPVDAQERLGLHVLIEDLKSKVNNEIIKMAGEVMSSSQSMKALEKR